MTRNEIREAIKKVIFEEIEPDSFIKNNKTKQEYLMAWSFIGSDGIPRELNSLAEADRQAVFADKIKGRHYWTRTNKSKETLADGTIIETIKRTITTKSYS